MPPRTASSVLRSSLESELHAAKSAAASCVLDSSWVFTVPSAVAAVPLSVYMRSYAPLVAAAVGASGLDYFRGMQQCSELTRDVKEVQLKIALLDLRTGGGNYHPR